METLTETLLENTTKKSNNQTFDTVIGIIDHPNFGKIEIHYTNNYEQIKDIPSNRAINTGHVDRLFKSVDEKELFTIIFVNEKLEIIDGQHRKAAFKKAKLPIAYAIIKNYGEEEISGYNSHNWNWNYDSYTDHYAQRNCPDYVEYRKFRNRYGIGHTMSMALLSGYFSTAGTGLTNAFKQGKFKIKDLARAQSIGENLKSMNFYPGWNSIGYW